MASGLNINPGTGRQPGIDYSMINFLDSGGNYGHFERSVDNATGFADNTAWVPAGVPAPANAPTSSDFYSWAVPDQSIGSSFMDFAKNAAPFAAGVAGLGFGLQGLLGAGGLGSGAAGGAMDMGIGGIGESMGLGAGYTSPTFGSMTGGGMDFSDWLASNSTGGAGSADWWSGLGLNSDPTQLLSGNGNLSMSDLTGGVLNNAGSTAGSSLLDQIKSLASNNPTALTKLLGTLGSTALGAYGANKQASSLNNLAQQSMNFGAPSRARFESSMSPGFDPNSIPGYSAAVNDAMKSTLAQLSAQSGNPFGNPGGLIDANKKVLAGTALPAINEYQRLNANTGFGNSMNSALNIQSDAIGADRGLTTALASGLGSLTQPTNDLDSLLRLLKGFQPNTGL